MSRTLVGTRIRERRRAKKISQINLAKEVGISPSYLNLIEHNRRGIAGKTLLTLAKALEINPRHLTEGADQGLIDRIKKAATTTAGVDAELQRTEEFIGRFPGFAQLVERLFDQVEIKDQTMQALSDKLSNDPFFAEAMHLMLSSITVIRSTTDILSNSDDLTDELQGRFLSNLHQESERLSKTAEDILKHLEPGDDRIEGQSDERRLELYLEERGYFIAPLEVDDEGIEAELLADGNISGNAKEQIDVLLEELAISHVDHERAHRTLTSYAQAAAVLPVDLFLKTARQEGFDPLALAQTFNVPLETVFWRLAHLPPGEEVPQFGLLECDGSAAVLYRKPLPNFSLPRYSSACPLWPVYGAMSQPLHPLAMTMTLPNGERFASYAIARFHQPGQPGVPGQLRSTMLITLKGALNRQKVEAVARPELDVGFQCSVCPRKDCPSRRNGYLLG